MDNPTNANQQPTATPTKPPSSAATVALLILAAIIILGAMFLFFIRRPNQPTMEAVSDLKNTPATTIPTTTTQESPTQNTTSTNQETTSTSPGIPEDEDIGGTDNAITLGETFQIFKGDTVTILQPKREMPRWNVTAKDFSDSRCPAGVQCIWAGEQSVTLVVTDLIARTAPQEITLGMVRNASQTVYGLNLHLSAIEEGKGGLYAEIETK